MSSSSGWVRNMTSTGALAGGRSMILGSPSRFRIPTWVSFRCATFHTTPSLERMMLPTLTSAQVPRSARMVVDLAAVDDDGWGGGVLDQPVDASSLGLV